MIKVSVVIPVYNVEKYLYRCIDSVLAQTYNNLEIILVNDGSTDSSGNICDWYKTQDKRIKVVHKNNGGLSSARNAGIDIATGEYICFIDSDDWIADDMVDILLTLCVKNAAQISVCKYQKVYDGITKTKVKKGKRCITTFSSIEALSSMFCSGGIGWSAAYKLYTRDLFENVRYPEGKIMEDMGTTYKLYSICEKVVFTNEVKYFYFIRPGSITRTLSSKRAKDAIYFIEEIIEYFQISYPSEVHLPQVFFAKIAPNFLTVLIATEKFDDEDILKCANAVREYGIMAIKSPIVKFRYKPVILGFKLILDITNNKVIETNLFKISCKHMSKYTK